MVYHRDVVEKHKGQLQKKMQHVCGTKKKIESALKTVKEMQDRVRKNEKKIKKEIDEKIDVKIAILEKMRATLKQESTNLTATKMKRLSLQQDGLEMQLASLKSAVEFTENILVKGSNNDVLSMKTQIESRLTELSKKEIDDEVYEEDKQILQVNEIPHSDLENYFVIKDGSAPDPKKCTVHRISNTNYIVVHVRNYLNQPIDIKTNRIKCKHSELSHFTCSKIMGKKGEYEMEFSRRLGLVQGWFLQVLIDEFIVRPMIIQE
ncbi:Tripartite motif-containing protein 45 [Exaiptasia diaphana]|nr:Tripartite motif-containing protein 45 [Exaiptasia diaphana]